MLKADQVILNKIISTTLAHYLESSKISKYTGYPNKSNPLIKIIKFISQTCYPTYFSSSVIEIISLLDSSQPVKYHHLTMKTD